MDYFKNIDWTEPLDLEKQREVVTSAMQSNPTGDTIEPSPAKGETRHGKQQSSVMKHRNQHFTRTTVEQVSRSPLAQNVFTKATKELLANS